ncbi:MAG: hypothetical protein KAS17_13115 [Victivallaceae bacterium]|nr:hypothetical protein [Victivallaceae bacterium]
MEMNGQFSKDPVERKKQMKEMLEQAVNLANVKMLGQIPPKEMRFRRIVASIFLLIVAIAFAYAIRTIIKTFAPPKIDGVKSITWGFLKYKWAYIILIPAVLSIFFWQYLPLAVGSKMAFQNYQIMKDSVWVGVDNFANVLWEP